MLLTLPTPITDGSLHGVTWDVEWEDNDRPQRTLYVAVGEEYRALISGSTHTALLAGLSSAALHGEDRIKVGTVDPKLLEGLEVVQSHFEHWRGLGPVNVEADALADPDRAVGRTSAAFLSGGVDSLSTLKKNLDTYPVGHPGRVTHALHVDLAGPERFEELGGEVSPRQASVAALLRVATDDLGIELVPVVTNIRVLENYEFNLDWMFHAHGAVLAAVAHAFDGAFERINIASSYDSAHLSPWGSHPLIDGRMSSSMLEFSHHNEQYSRQQKLEMIAGWQAGIEALDVCFHWSDRAEGKRNCGACEKCVRTKAGFLAAGVDPKDTGAFEDSSFTVKKLLSMPLLKDDYERFAWGEIKDVMESRNRPEASIVRTMLQKDMVLRRLDSPPLRLGLKAVKAVKARLG